MRRLTQRYLLSLLGTLLVGLVVLISVNGLIDPFGVYCWIGQTRLDDYKYWNRSRLIKAEIARNHPFDVLLVGGSRVHIGLNPRFRGFGGDRVFNLGLGGGTNYEFARLIEQSLSHPPRLMILSQFWLTANPQLLSKGNGDFVRSRINPNLDYIEYHARNLLSHQATDQSLETVKYYLRGEQRNDSGQLCIREGWVPNYREYFDRILKTDLGNWRRVAAQQGQQEPGDNRPFMARLFAKCQANGIQLKIMIPPVHAVYLEGVWQTGQWAEFENAKRCLVALVTQANRHAADRIPIEIWDFSSFSGYNAEPLGTREQTQPMQWYWDPSHFRTELGDRVLSRLLAFAPPREGFGVRLSAATLEPHLRQLRRDHRRFIELHPQQVQLVEQCINELESNRR
ncbi:MAG: hypothetical protein CMJ59_13610 [Planctomycetaceae bacterium]|nr:hypothetical protein [Planctomycetaceae bacterium]